MIKDYKGIQVILKYTEPGFSGKCRRKNYKILTGWRMGIYKILLSIAKETSLLIATNKILPQIVCSCENDEYRCANQFQQPIFFYMLKKGKKTVKHINQMMPDRNYPKNISINSPQSFKYFE